MYSRIARPEEFPAVQKFYWELIDLMQGQKDTIGWKKGIYPTDEFLMTSLEKGELYIIEDDHSIIAAVIVNSAWNEGYEGLPWTVSCDPSLVLVPHALGVDPRLQKTGLGKKLVADILEAAREKGMKTVRLDILKGNTAAERLYTSMGFRFVAEKTMFYEDTGWTAYQMFEQNIL